MLQWLCRPMWGSYTEPYYVDGALSKPHSIGQKRLGLWICNLVLSCLLNSRKRVLLLIVGGGGGGGKICLEFWKHLEAEQPTFLAGNADGVKCNGCRQQRSIHAHLCSAIECLGRSTQRGWKLPSRGEARIESIQDGHCLRRTMGISGNIPNQVKTMFPFIRKNLQWLLLVFLLF